MFCRFLLSKNKIKPTVTIDNQLLCMIDTGAEFPVWCHEETLLKEQYPEAAACGATWISGFGGKGSPVKVFQIPDFKFGSFTYTRLLVAVCPEIYLGVDFVFAITMFTKMNITLKYAQQPGMIEFESDRDTFGFGAKTNASGLITEVFCLSQEEWTDINS